MNDKVTEEFLVDHSYIWLVAKSMVEYMGFSDMTDFVNSNCYIKANLSKNEVVERVSGRMDLTQYPGLYTGFVYAFAKSIFPGGDTEQLIYDLDRNNLLGKYDGKNYFIHKEYSISNNEKSILQFEVYCQMYLKEEDVYASILLIDISALYNKSVTKRIHSEFDTLSGVFNLAYGERLSVEYLQYHPDSIAAVVVVNVDRFTELNTKYGHKFGNSIIVDLASILTDIFDKNCIISRTSSDEFTILIKNESQRQVDDAIGYVLDTEMCKTVKDESIPYTVSIGYAMYPEDSRDYSELCRMAEMAQDYAREKEIDYSIASLRFTKDMMHPATTHTGLNMMDIADGIPGAILVYRADGDEEILYANNETIRLFDCEDFEDFMAWVHGNFKDFVYKEDLERVQAAIKSRLNEPDENKVAHIGYRIVTKSGVIHEIDDTGRLVDSPYYGKIFYVFLQDASRA